MFDLTKSLFSMTVFSAVMAVILIGFLLTQRKPRIDGLAEMAAADALATVAALFGNHAAAHRSPEAGFVPIFAFVVCVLRSCRAMRRLQRRPSCRALEATALGLSAVGAYVFLVVQNNLAHALVLNAAIHVVVCTVTARDLLTERRLGLRSGCRILGVMFALFAALQVVRVVARPLRQQPGALGDQVVLLDHVGIFVGMAVAIGWSLGLLWASYRNAEIQLRAANRELEHVANAVAHDLKSPLNAVVGYLQLIDVAKARGNAEQVSAYAEIAL